MSFCLIDIFTYALIEATNRKPSSEYFYYWILSVILVIMTLVDLTFLFLKGRESTFEIKEGETTNNYLLVQ